MSNKLSRDEILSMEAGREMDTLVAEQVMGWTCEHMEPGMFRDDKGLAWVLSRTWTPRTPHKRFLPSDDIAAAWQVMEKLYDDKWIVGIGSLAQVPRGWRCELCNMWEDDFGRCPSDIEANAETAPLAICRAALLAITEAA